MNSELLTTTLLLLILLDPIGNVPVLVSLMRQLPVVRHNKIILRENFVAGLLLLVFVFVGDAVLAAMHLSDSALEISGGLILFMIAVRMVFPVHTVTEQDTEFDDEPFIVPIAIPMIAGPAALATVLLTARQADSRLTLMAGIVIAMILNTIILLAANRLARLFGKAGLAAMERLMGLVLTTMAVQMLISGIKSAFITNA